MNRTQLLEQGRKLCDALLAQYPSLQAILSISRQIDYLMGLDSGAISDRSRLKEITIGVLTAREIEPLDDEASEVFYKISSEASRM